MTDPTYTPNNPEEGYKNCGRITVEGKMSEGASSPEPKAEPKAEPEAEPVSAWGSKKKTSKKKAKE